MFGEALGKGFEKAIAGLKREEPDPTEAGNLASLLISLGNAVDDGTTLLCGFAIVTAIAPFMQLKGMTMVNPSIKEALRETSRDLTIGLSSLRAALDVTKSDQPDPAQVLGALGPIAKAGLRLGQKAQQMAQLAPLLGGRNEE